MEDPNEAPPNFLPHSHFTPFMPPAQIYPDPNIYYHAPYPPPAPLGSWMAAPLSMQQQYGSAPDNGGAPLSPAPGDAEMAGGEGEPVAADEGEPGVGLEEKPLGDLACQRFRRVKRRPEEVAQRQKQKAQSKLVRRGRGNAARWGDGAPAVAAAAEEGEGMSVANSEAGTANAELEAEMGEVVDNPPGNTVGEEEEEEPLDAEAEAEADEFYSQLIDLPEEDDTDDVPVKADAPGKKMLLRRGNLRWSEDECALLRQCAALYETNYCMIQTVLTHRSIAEIKKQLDRQRHTYPNLFAHFAMTPRFHTVNEYYRHKAALQQDKQRFERDMAGRGVRPWADMLGLTEGDAPVQPPAEEAPKMAKRGRKRKTAT
ncbi:uncharacterized protein LOC129598399 isoform X2 [Paramacrobiotus metropolitanus]|uniref:uncharacterized protein LOC129598399 isoform X2 n=1 Tax=Paramacrobiotus metropolitanus TaxID=2943436 RepID=UPI002445D394|nr:uncharacterized protein LOC129598399 isoform X2 [Paramacrobiotus metropolitanus]